MAKFEWACHDCKLLIEKEYAVGKAPQRKKCPECKKMVGRYYGGINISFSDDLAFHTVRRRYDKHAERGFDKDAADRFLRNAIKDTKQRTQEQESIYKPARINYDKLRKEGKVRKLSQKEQADKIERAKKLTAEAYDKAKLDITKPQKQQ